MLRWMFFLRVFNVSRFYVCMLGRIEEICSAFVCPARFLLWNNSCFITFLSKYNDDDDDDDTLGSVYSLYKGTDVLTGTARKLKDNRKLHRIFLMALLWQQSSKKNFTAKSRKQQGWRSLLM